MPILLAVPSSHQIRPNSDQIELTRRRPSVEGRGAGEGAPKWQPESLATLLPLLSLATPIGLEEGAFRSLSSIVP